MGDLTDQLDRLLATARRVAESLDLETVLAAIVEDATSLLGADSGDMLLWDRVTDRLRVVAVSNFPPEMLGFELAFGEGVSSQAIRAQRTIEVDHYASYEHRARGLDAYDFGTVLCAPLIFRGSAIGAINVHMRTGRQGFGPGAADLLAAFAGHAAIAVDHARRYENEVALGRALTESNRDLTRSLTVQQRLADQVLLDSGPAGIAQVLAEHLGRRIVIEDDLRRPVAGAAPDGGDDWRVLLDASEGTAGKSGIVAGTAPHIVPVRVGADIVGYLLLSADEDLGPIDRALVDVATTGVALEFAKVRAADEVESRLQGAAAADLLNGSYPSEDSITARAARLGYDLGRLRDLLVIDVAGAEDDSPSTARSETQRRLLAAVRERLATRRPGSLAVWHAGSIAVLAAQGRRGELDARGLAQELKESLAPNLVPACVTIALSDPCLRPDDYAPAFRLAQETVALMIRLGRAGAIVGARELGSYGLLLRASPRDDLESFARERIRPIVEHDRRHGGELVRTLRAYLDAGGVQRRVAERCFVHVNTVVYRLRRIRELLAVDLDDPSVIFDLTLALHILDVIGDAGRTGDSRGLENEPTAADRSAGFSRRGRSRS
jgi:sugar diacid utilization regulator